MRTMTADDDDEVTFPYSNLSRANKFAS